MGTHGEPGYKAIIMYIHASYLSHMQLHQSYIQVNYAVLFAPGKRGHLLPT